jgi:hypothetical protein
MAKRSDDLATLHARFLAKQSEEMRDPSRRWNRESTRKIRRLARQGVKTTSDLINDHRLAPGIWWPLSAEAEDVIHCIETGQWLTPDAAERWPADGERGDFERD